MAYLVQAAKLHCGGNQLMPFTKACAFQVYEIVNIEAPPLENLTNGFQNILAYERFNPTAASILTNVFKLVGKKLKARAGVEIDWKGEEDFVSDGNVLTMTGVNAKGHTN